MKHAATPGLLLGLLLLQGCASTPRVTLTPEDVPALYAAPLPSQANAVAPASDDGDVATTASKLPEKAEATLAVGDEAALAASNDASVVLTAHDDTPPSAEFPVAPEVATAEPSAMPDQRLCAAIEDEIQAIDAGLGAPAVEKAPAAKPGALAKAGHYARDLAVETVMGQLQVFIQTKRAIFNDSEKERRIAESTERGTTRRAYLMGYGQASGCQLAGPTVLAEQSAKDSGVNALLPLN